MRAAPKPYKWMWATNIAAAQKHRANLDAEAVATNCRRNVPFRLISASGKPTPPTALPVKAINQMGIALVAASAPPLDSAFSMTGALATNASCSMALSIPPTAAQASPTQTAPPPPSALLALVSAASRLKPARAAAASPSVPARTLAAVSPADATGIDFVCATAAMAVPSTSLFQFWIVRLVVVERSRVRHGSLQTHMIPIQRLVPVATPRWCTAFPNPTPPPPHKSEHTTTAAATVPSAPLHA